MVVLRYERYDLQFAGFDTELAYTDRSMRVTMDSSATLDKAALAVFPWLISSLCALFLHNGSLSPEFLTYTPQWQHLEATISLNSRPHFSLYNIHAWCVHLSNRQHNKPFPLQHNKHGQTERLRMAAELQATSQSISRHRDGYRR